MAHPPAGSSFRWGFPTARSRAWWIAGIYAVIALLWIYYSDSALGLLADREAVLRLGMYKGALFVLVTSLLLLVLMRRAFGDNEQLLHELRCELAAGCNGYIEKPIDPSSFLDEIAAYLTPAKAGSPPP